MIDPFFIEKLRNIIDQLYLDFESSTFEPRYLVFSVLYLELFNVNEIN